jgi:opacity protein-like surface antigen
LQSVGNLSFANNFLHGFETDFDGATIRGKVALNASGFSGPGTLAVSGGSTINDLGTVRGRVGYSWDRFLVYATRGFAYGQVNSQVNISVPGGGGVSIAVSPMRMGWTVGGGFEYAITNNLTIKTEYLYVDLGNNSELFDGALQNPITCSTPRGYTSCGRTERFRRAPAAGRHSAGNTIGRALARSACRAPRRGRCAG